MRKGFTLLELILYMAIVSLLSGALITFGWNVVLSGTKSSVQQEVSGNARFLTKKITLLIRGATALNPSDWGVNLAADPTKQFSLNDPAYGATVLQVNSAGQATITYGGYTYELNSPKTKITNLTFINYSSGDGKTKNIQYNLTIEANYGSSRQEYQQNLILEGDAELRSN